MPILRLAIATPLRRLFDYLPPADLKAEAAAALAPGTRVLAPFGHRQVCGVLVEIAETSELPAEKLKPALEILDPEPLVSQAVQALCSWAAEYYRHPLGEVFAAAFPTGLRRGKASGADTEPVWRLSQRGKGLPEGALKSAPRQAELLAELQQASALTWEQLKARGHNTATRRALRDKGLIEEHQRPIEPEQPTWIPGPDLSPEQAAALEAIDSNRFAGYLLHGVTGSGKTEVYLQLVERALASGRQALLLVPEIGLTPQLAERLTRRFAVEIAALHSGLADGAREAAWEAARSGRAHIVIGTRSAVFASLARPGLIVVDEEHDASFKQQDGFRYSARDLAVKRAQLENVPVILGSATPSLESLQNARSGRYHHLRLTERIGTARLPRVDIVDVRRLPLRGGLSEALLSAVSDELDAGNQNLLFLNRRGYAPTLQCHDCGFIANCRHCDARLTLHRAARELRCHHCEWRAPLPNRCPDCQGSALNARGVGTEQAESVLQERFPKYPIHRVDRDSMQKRGAMAALMDTVNSGDPCILLGTQMLTKGHHFPGVTLVGLLDTDAALFSADFRGPERMGQLITQVSGRAGRAERPGRVILQTHYPDHPLLRTLLERGYDDYAGQLLAEREQQSLPPFGQLLMLRAEAASLDSAEQFLAGLRQATTAGNAQLIGPLPAPMQRRGGRFRAQLLGLAASRSALQQLAVQLVTAAENSPAGKRLRWSLDIDPTES
ncbi:MAG: primosomal protein N' [Halieaceae bacterium]|jgi:primosomal protein N' (replication factor Y)|nr:primosomal protein N' [Halieaceae bacterium]